MKPSLDVVIVNWNSGEQLRACIRSLAAARQEGFQISRVVVVDNASKDDSAKTLDSAGIPLVVIENDANRGFAAACNQGAAGSEADYLLFLNPDAEVFPETLAQSVAFMEGAFDRKIGILGVQLLNDAGEVSRSCARFPKPSSILGQALGLNRILPSRFPNHFYVEWDHRDSRSVDQVIGAYFFVRKPLFDSLGGFDERFFVYFEEVDLSVRAKQAGWLSWYESSIRAYHKGCGTTDQVRARRLYYSVHSRLKFSKKHFSLAGRALVVFASCLIEPFMRILAAVAKLSKREIADVLGGYSLLFGAMTGLHSAPKASAKVHDKSHVVSGAR